MISTRQLTRLVAPSLRSTTRSLTVLAPRRSVVVLRPAQQLRAFSRSSSLFNTPQNEPKWASGAKVEYNELKKITEAPNDDILLIDVREPAEVTLGSIPSSVNLPLSTFEKSLSMDEGDFTRVHGFHKPTKNQPIIFYCRAGVRAQTALDLAKRQGYSKVRNFEGSWLEWEAKNANKGNQDD